MRKVFAAAKPLLAKAGIVLAVAGLFFVIFRLREALLRTNTDLSSLTLWLQISALSFFYGCTNLLLGVAYQKLVAHFGIKLGLIYSEKMYGITQLSKYVPGNIFHLASRQAIALNDDLDSKIIAKSSFLELLFLASAATCFLFISLPTLIPTITFGWSLVSFIAVSALILTLASKAISGHAGMALAIYLVFFAISGCIFATLLMNVSQQQHSVSHYGLAAGAFVVAWLAGFLTPGAPAGLGVRELILLFILSSTWPSSEVLIATALGRVVTIVGDILYFLTALLLPKKLDRIS